MCHGKVHYQGVRRRESVILSLRFLQDYIVFDLDVSSFLTRIYKQPNREPEKLLTLVDKSVNDPQKCHT